MKPISHLLSRSLVALSVFCLALFLMSSVAATPVFANRAIAVTSSGNLDGIRGYSTSNAPSLASGACPSPIQKGTAANIALGSGVEPTGVAYDPKNKNLYVTTTQGYFEAISTTTNKIVGGKIAVDNSLGAIAVDTSSGQVFVASKTQSEVYIFNPVVAKGIALPTNSIPTYMIYDAFNGKVYVSDTFAKSISVILPSSHAITNIPLGGANPQPWGLAYDTYNGFVFVADRSDGTIQVISGATNNILRTLTPNVANSGPTGVAFDPFNNMLYVTAAFTDDVFVYNVTGNAYSNYKELADIQLNTGSSPFGVDVDCSDGNVWIADSGTSQVELLSTCQSKVIGPPISTGISVPNWFAFDPVNHWMYVTSTGSDSVEAISADSRTANNAIDCPMGITDYGTNGAIQTSYTTKEFVSTTTITSLNIGTSSNAAYNGISSVQLNGVAYGIAEGTNAGGVYWIQDIVDFKQLG